MSDLPPPLRETLALPGRGRLELQLDTRSVTFFSDTGAPKRFDAHPIFEDPGDLHHAAAADGRSLLLARHASDRLHLFDADLGVFRSVPGFERLRHSEEQKLHALSGGFLVITENGLAFLDTAGRLRWRMDEVTSGWRLLAEADGVLWVGDGVGNVIGLDAGTGFEVGG